MPHDTHRDDQHDGLAKASGTPPDTASEALVELGTWPRLEAQILRHRLETAAIPVLARWSGDGRRAAGSLAVPVAHEMFARAVINEIDVDDEVPDTSPLAYLARIEEHLHALAGLLDELRSRIDETEPR